MNLAWTMVRHRFGAFAGTFVAIALGVALVAGAGSLWASSRPQAPERLAGAPVLVHSPSAGTGDDGLPDYRPWTPAQASALAGKLATVPGVTAAVPDPAFYVQRLVDGRATGDPQTSLTAGHAWSSAALGGYRLTSGRAPVKAGEVVLGDGVTSAGKVEVVTAEGAATWTVTGSMDGPGFYVSDAEAAEHARLVQVIGLSGDADPAAVRSAVGGDGLVWTGGERDQVEDESVTRIRWLGAQLIIAMLFLGTFAAVFVVSSTCALSAAQRRREIGLLRAVGATPGQVTRLMYAETLVVAVLGGAVGVPAGALAAPLLAPPLVDAGLEPAGFAVSPQPPVLAAAFLLGILVSLAGVATAARRSSRVPALDALRDAAVERRAMTVPRWVLGLLTAAGGGALTVALPALPVMTQTTAALFAAMLMLVAAALLAPVVIVPLVRLVTWPWRRSATGMLVREGTLTGVRRVASTAAPVLLTVGFATLLTGTIATINQATSIDETAKLGVATVAVPDNTPGLSAEAVRRQRGEPIRERDSSVMVEAVLLDGPAVPAAGLKELTSAEYVRARIDEEDQIIQLFLVVLVSLTVGYTGVAVANTLLMATAARRGEFRAVRLAGGGTGHVLRIATGEALLAVTAGTLLGGGVAVAALLGMQRATEHELKQSIELVVPWGQAVPVVVICALIAVIAAGTPVLRHSRET
ncbi:FtsX-like permease family protein [Actinoplanes sp. NPDC051494]|uniref:ABC transporter permease n=1 Tax=Actinoplanes sp. NPDC051494 TaxID=3363907 RepID=UPI0037A52AEC